MTTATTLTRQERHANLLAGLNDAPSALTGWPDVLEVAYELGGRKAGSVYYQSPDLITPRRLRLARTWRPIASRRLSATFQRAGAIVEAAAEGIAKAFAGIVFPGATKDDFVLADGSRK